MSQQLKCNCYIKGKRKSKADRKTCTDVKTHIFNKLVEDHFQIVEESDEESDEETDEKKIEEKSEGASQPGKA